MSAAKGEVSPILRLARVHVRGLRSIRRLDLPEMGLGWGERFPEVAVLGGANGSGKTTFLRLVAQAGRILLSPTAEVPQEAAADECLLDFQLTDAEGEGGEIRFLVGGADFVDEHETANCFGYVVTGARPRTIQRGGVVELRKTLRPPTRFARSRFPRLIHFPSDERDLITPKVKYKAPGKLNDEAGFVAWWERPGATQWAGTLPELLFSARWAEITWGRSATRRRCSSPP